MTPTFIHRPIHRLQKLLRAGSQEPPGLVERLDREGVAGWVSRQGTSDVEIIVNGSVVATTFPSQPRSVNGSKSDNGFSRTLKDLWKYLGQGDCIEVRYAGKLLPIEGHGERWVCDNGKDSRSGKLLEYISKGRVFNKYGRLRLAMRADDGYQGWCLETYYTLKDEIRQAIGCDSFAIYGTMLGAVREGDFIGHDNDFDMVYVSKHSEPKAVKAEFVRLCEYLIEAGYWLKPKKTHTWIRRRETRQKMDIFFGWFDVEDRFHLSYGYHGEPVGRKGFDERTPYMLAGRRILLPVASPAILEQTFGKGWNSPDPGFKHHSSSRRIDKSYFVDSARLSKLYWKQFYRDNNVTDGSPFATFVAGRLSPKSTVIEIGCGTGRDAIFFAQHGHAVFGADRAEEGIKRASIAADEGKLQAAFQVVDAANRAELAEFVSNIPESDQVVIYMRFFLHSIPRSVQELIFDEISRLPIGFLLALEFRTDKDELQPKVYGEHYRRYIKPSEVVESLEHRGLKIVFEEAGTGMSPFGDEDPHLARILARKP